MRQHYQLSRFGNLLQAQAAIGSRGGQVGRFRLLVDTGASYTMLPVEVLETLGYDTHHPIRTVRMVAANGIIVAPVVTVAWFSCLGQRLEEFPVVAHTLPAGTKADGLLGMDVLLGCQAIISVAEAKITFGN